MNGMKLIKDYVESELNFYRKECNFTEDELAWFNMKSKEWSDVKIAMELDMSVSKVNKLSGKVRAKIKRVDELYRNSRVQIKL